LAGVLLLRQVIGLRGRRAAYGTLAGVMCVLLVLLVYAVRGGAA
jgi:threonine/homoserine/homoserine lactone efflux protein